MNGGSYFQLSPYTQIRLITFNFLSIVLVCRPQHPLQAEGCGSSRRDNRSRAHSAVVDNIHQQYIQYVCAPQKIHNTHSQDHQKKVTSPRGRSPNSNVLDGLHFLNAYLLRKLNAPRSIFISSCGLAGHRLNREMYAQTYDIWDGGSSMYMDFGMAVFIAVHYI